MTLIIYFYVKIYIIIIIIIIKMDIIINIIIYIIIIISIYIYYSRQVKLLYNNKNRKWILFKAVTFYIIIIIYTACSY